MKIILHEIYIFNNWTLRNFMRILAKLPNVSWKIWTSCVQLFSSLYIVHLFFRFIQTRTLTRRLEYFSYFKNAFNTNVNDLNPILKFPQPNAAACCMKTLCLCLRERNFIELYSHTNVLSHIQRCFIVEIVVDVLIESIFSDILIVNFRFS